MQTSAWFIEFVNKYIVFFLTSHTVFIDPLQVIHTVA